MLTSLRVQAPAAKAWKSILIFLISAYSIAWALWLPLILGPAGLRVTHYDAYLPFFVSLGTIGPLIASFLATRYESGRWAMPSNFLPTPQLRSWLNLLIGPVLTIVSFVIIPYMICAAPGHELVTPRILLPLLAIWPNILGGPLEEEFGWRGYLLPRMAARFGNAWASVIVGVIWASWHLPLIVSHVWAGVSFWYFLPMITALAVFASLAYFATGRSILGPIIVHYVFNTCSKMIGVAFNGQPLHRDRYRNAEEIIVVCMIGVALLTIAATRGKVGESQSS